MLNPHPVVTSTTSSGQHAREARPSLDWFLEPQKACMSSDTLLTRGDRETHLPQAMAALEASDRRGKHKARAAVLAAHKAQHSAGAGGGAGVGLRPAPSPGLGLGERVFSVRGPAWSARFSPNFFLNVASL